MPDNKLTALNTAVDVKDDVSVTSTPELAGRTKCLCNQELVSVRSPRFCSQFTIL